MSTVDQVTTALEGDNTVTAAKSKQQHHSYVCSYLECRLLFSLLQAGRGAELEGGRGDVTASGVKQARGVSAGVRYSQEGTPGDEQRILVCWACLWIVGAHGSQTTATILRAKHKNTHVSAGHLPDAVAPVDHHDLALFARTAANRHPRRSDRGKGEGGGGGRGRGDLVGTFRARCHQTLRASAPLERHKRPRVRGVRWEHQDTSTRTPPWYSTFVLRSPRDRVERGTRPTAEVRCTATGRGETGYNPTRKCTRQQAVPNIGRARGGVGAFPPA